MKMTTRSTINTIAIGSIATMAMAFGAGNQAQAATISSLQNTGVGTYTLTGPTNNPISVSSLDNTAFPANIYNDVAYGANSYKGNNAISSWISPSANTNEETKGQDVAGQYTFSTTFDLTGMDLSSVVIAGKWVTDDQGAQIKINGVNTLASAVTNGFYNDGFTTFNLSSGFVSGINTLDFVVDNQALGYASLRVEIDSATANLAAASATDVPEPSDLLGTVFAFGSVVLIKRRLTKKN
jgi:hypothetical protein